MNLILFLAANPKDTTRLELGKEVNKIDGAIQSARYRDQFDLKQRHAVNITELQGLFLRFEPSIVHFSGHGSQESALIFEQDDGTSITAPPSALTDLFRIINQNKKIQCVILNACYSEEQAEAIGKHVPCVIGMSTAISDEAAIKFSTSFYRALTNGQSINNAFELGLNQLDLHSIPESDTPKLKCSSVDPTQIFLINNGENSDKPRRSKPSPEPIADKFESTQSSISFNPIGNWNFSINNLTGSVGQVQFTHVGEFYVDLLEQALNQRSTINGVWQFDQQTQILMLQGVLNGTLPWNYIITIQNHSSNHFSGFTPDGFQISFTKI